MPDICREWPWLATPNPQASRLTKKNGYGAFVYSIGYLFNEVCGGEITLDALASQVRIWEDEFDDNLRADAPQREEVNEHASNSDRGAARGDDSACDAATETSHAHASAHVQVSG